MEAIAKMFHQLQETLNSELDTITSVVTEEEKDVINNIKLNTAAKISEIKLLISSCERVGSIRFDAQNKIKFYRNEPIVVLTDYVRHPNTVRAKATYALTWNINHKLNVVQANVLSTKNHETSQMMAILAVITQLEVLKFGAIKVLSNSRILKHRLDNLEENMRIARIDAPNSLGQSLQRKIWEQLSKARIKIEVLHPNEIPELSSMHASLEAHANEKIREYNAST